MGLVRQVGYDHQPYQPHQPTSPTKPHPPYLKVQTDGNVVIYSSDGSSALWHTGTCCY